MFDAGGSGGATAAAVTSLDALTGALARAIDGLLDVDPDGVADGELAEAMLSLRREQARLAAVVAEQTAAFEARQGYAEDGSRSATDWIAVHARLPRGPVAGEVRDARRLRSMPETRAAFRAGEMSAAHVRVLCSPGGASPGRAAFPRRGGPPGRRGAPVAVRRLAAAVRVLARRGRPGRARTAAWPRQRPAPVPHRCRPRRRGACRRLPHPGGHRRGERGVGADRTRAVRRRLGRGQGHPRRRHHRSPSGPHHCAAAPRRPGRDGHPGPDRPRRRQTARPAGHGDGRLRHLRRPGLRTRGRDRHRSRRGGRNVGPRRDVDPTGGGRRPQPGARHQLGPQLPGHPAPRPRRPAPALRPQDLLRPRRPMPRRPHPRLVATAG